MSDTGKKISVSSSDCELLDLETNQGIQIFENVRSLAYKDQYFTMKSKTESNNDLDKKVKLPEDVLKKQDQEQHSADKQYCKKGKDLSKIGVDDIHDVWRSVKSNSDVGKLIEIFKFPKRFLSLGGLTLNMSITDTGQLILSKNRVPVGLNMCQKILLVCMILLHVSNTVRTVAFCVLHVPYAKDDVKVMLFETLFFMFYGTALYISGWIVTATYSPIMLEILANYCKTFGFLKDLKKPRKYTQRLSVAVFVANIVFALFWAAFGMLTNLEYMLFPASELVGQQSVSRFIGFATLATAVIFLGIPIYGFLLFYTTILHIIKSELDEATKEMARVLSANDQSVDSMFDHCRERHQFLCRLVATLSRLTRTYIVLTIFFDMIIICLSIFGLSGNKVTTEMILAQIHNIVMSLIRISFICVVWSGLHTSAHFFSSALCDANWFKLSKPVLHKINLVLAQCSNNKIGIDIYGLFTIDSSTILTILGTLVTYGVVVLQFQLDDDPLAQCCTNNTGNNRTEL